MTPEQIQLIRDSFEKVAPNADKAAALFYSLLFEADPSVKPLFKANLEEQGSKLMKMIGTAVNNLHDLDTLVPVLEDLGRRHVDYGVKNEQYDTVGSCLIETLSKGLGEDFTPETKEAWVTAYQLMAKVMTEAADAVAS